LWICSRRKRARIGGHPARHRRDAAARYDEETLLG